MNKKIKKLSFIAVLSACLCVVSPWSIHIGQIPITLATFAIYIIGSVTRKLDGLIVTLIYIFIGIIGIPVFSSFQAGIGSILGITGGYIIGFLPCIWIINLFTCINKQKFFWYPFSMLLGTIVCYIIGSIWYMIQTENTLQNTFLVCIAPFIIFDAIKIIVASIIGYIMNVRITLFYSIYAE